MKFFDYKFILVLALSMVVYFIYREVEQINKRLTKLEHNYNKSMITPIPVDKPTTPPLPLPLPLPPSPSHETISLTKINPNEDKPMGTVEEYSNEVLIYSNDMSANEHDTVMVESIVDMTKNVDSETEIESDTTETFLHSESITSTTSDDLSSNDIKCEKNNLKFSPEKNNDDIPVIVDVAVDVPVIDDLPSLTENKKMSTDNLSKKKLNELQDLATSHGISIVIDNGKKKTKVQLRQEISAKNNI